MDFAAFSYLLGSSFFFRTPPIIKHETNTHVLDDSMMGLGNWCEYRFCWCCHCRAGGNMHAYYYSRVRVNTYVIPDPRYTAVRPYVRTAVASHSSVGNYSAPDIVLVYTPFVQR